MNGGVVEREVARQLREVDGVPADVAVLYLRELATTWHKADGGPGRRMLAEALFDRIDAAGFREATLRLTNSAIAHGFASVIPERLELTVGDGRGERDSPSRTQRPGPFLLINRTGGRALGKESA